MERKLYVDYTLGELMANPDKEVSNAAFVYLNKLTRHEDKKLEKLLGHIRKAGKKGGPRVIFTPDFKKATIELAK